MKKLLLPVIVVCAVLMPLQLVSAKTYGGFKPGKKFSFRVTEVISSKSVGTKITKKRAKIPKGIPKLKKRQKVKFKIGKKGKITFKGTSIPFKTDGGSANIYSLIKTGTTTKANIAEVFKNSKGRPTGAALSFTLTKIAGFQTSSNMVLYTLK